MEINLRATLVKKNTIKLLRASDLWENLMKPVENIPPPKLNDQKCFLGQLVFFYIVYCYKKWNITPNVYYCNASIVLIEVAVFRYLLKWA